MPLLTYGADPALKDRKGRTAGDIAKLKGNQDAIVLLSKP
jgi:ankyrin repeat protein